MAGFGVTSDCLRAKFRCLSSSTGEHSFNTKFVSYPIPRLNFGECVVTVASQLVKPGVVLSSTDNSNDISTKVGERLPSSLVAAFLARSVIKPFKSGAILIAEGSTARDVFLIRSGTTRVLLSSASGREVILRQLGPDHIFGEMAAIDGARRSARIAAISDGTIAVMSGDDFVEFLAEVPEAGLWMIREMTARVRDLTEKTYALALLPANTRIQAELLRLARRDPAFADGEETVDIPNFPTHAEIAARAGTHREGVSRELSFLAKEGIIEQNGRKMVIHSLPKLRAIYERIGQ